MNADDPNGYAELWLSELGAYVPQWHDGEVLGPREPAFGMRLTQHERARRHGLRLEHERGARRA